MEINILREQPLDNLLTAKEIFEKSNAETNSKWLSLLGVYNAGMIEGKRIERAKKCKS
ncbi:hypothetical protein [Streptococcus uberis]|uniref:hypothetical protein n=1 Tax=Streptococcus uberis TaxID=1349 RepID=UPI0018A6E738|nr:hypothetical protein [Streptococcus uberis]